ncbi:MAG: hypothetical protein ACK5WZ_03065, partial [Pseudobdellovibrionaceae bacterium]
LKATVEPDVFVGLLVPSSVTPQFPYISMNPDGQEAIGGTTPGFSPAKGTSAFVVDDPPQPASEAKDISIRKPRWNAKVLFF